jgi:hypothetical protein
MFPSRIRRRLWRCRLRPRRAFGCESHGFRMSLPVWESTLATYERRHSFKIPGEYRNFLRETGDGPAGPAYGLFPLAKSIALAVENIPDALSQNFPFVAGADAENSELIAGIERAESTTDCDVFASMWDQAGVGSLPLCDEGCNYLHRLVVNGPLAGSMWIDGRSADAGVWPLNVGFNEWFERWLADVEVGGKGTWWHQRQPS